MKKIILRFYGRLTKIANKILEEKEVIGKPAIIDIIESCGIPRTEVYLIIKNKNISSFYETIENNDYISVYPKMMQLYCEIYKHIISCANYTKVLKKEIREKSQYYKIEKFIADVHLGKLVLYLRLLGVDVLYNIEWNDEELIDISTKEKRILLTQDKGILKQKKLKYGSYIISQDPIQQLQDFLSLYSVSIRPFSRCTICNSILKKIPKELLANHSNDNIPPKVMDLYPFFYYCFVCNKYYWEGSHYKNIVSFFKSLIV